jgi:hypothetical protein
MRAISSTVIAAFAVVGCHEPKTSLHVTETRPLTLHDRSFVGDFKNRPPLDWRRLPGTDFRLLNFVAGENEEVEIVLGETRGGVLANAKRWLGQFGLTEVRSLEELGKTTMMGRDAYIVEGKGTYAPGMGRGEQEGYAMIGLILEGATNQVTLKMTGPADAVEAQREAFFEYSRSFTKVDDHLIQPGNEPEQENNPSALEGYE